MDLKRVNSQGTELDLGSVIDVAQDFLVLNLLQKAKGQLPGPAAADRNPPSY
jgi:hypothetical protein